MISINFDNLLADYNNQLGLKLRGDRTNEEHLQFWVPSEDITESLLNLIDSLKETHNLKFEIKVDTKKFNNESLTNFKKILSNIGNYSLEEKINNFNFLIELNSQNYDNYFKADLKKQKINTKKKKDQINEVENIFEKKAIHPEYIDAISKVFKDEKKLNNNTLNSKDKFKNYKIFKKKYEVGELQLIYNEEKTFFKILLETNKKYLDDKEVLNQAIFILNTIMKEMDFIEIKHHSLIYFIDKLLDTRKLNNLGGIIHPENIGRLFYEIKIFYAEAANEILDKKNFIINKNYPELKKFWLEKNLKEKNKVINEEISLFCSNKNLEKNSISLIDLKDFFKVWVKYTDNIKTSSKSENFFLSLEKYLKEKIDFRIEVFTLEKNDDNKLRTKNLK